MKKLNLILLIFITSQLTYSNNMHFMLSNSNETVISDTVAPTVPANLISSNITQTSFTLSWTASTDNVSVFGYEIFKNGIYYGATTTTTINITGLTCGNTYNFTVNAFDNAQPANISAFSIPKSVTTSNCGANSAPTHLKYFGFFFIDVGYDDNPNDGIIKNNYTDEVASFTNLAQMASYYPTENLNARITSMNSQCVKPFVSLQEIFHSRIVDPTTQSGFRYVLYPDYQTRWNDFKTTNNPSLTASKIGAFYLSDEPTYNGVSFAELNTISQLIKNDFPTIPILLVEAYVSITNLQVPTSVDWLGFDQYFMFNPSTNTGFLQNLANLKTKRSTPNQKIFITIDDSWIPSYGNAGQTQAMMANTVQDYYNLAASDTDIIGLLAWIWPNGVDQPAHVGARSLPQNVKDKNIEIGNLIKTNFNPCNVALSSNNNFEIKNDFEVKLYPNPASNYTTLEYDLRENSEVRVIIYDLLGNVIQNLDNINQNSGYQKLNLNTSMLSNGLYNVKIIINNNQFNKLILINKQ